MEEQFIIPIDKAIIDFKNHLEVNDRTILSSGFGDGKSFFLSRFVEDEDVKKEYTFLTLYPVNYQVTENRDIFEIIKRDILIQMLCKGIIKPDYEISNKIAFWLYLQNKPFGFIESCLPLITETISNNENAKYTVTAVSAIVTFLKSINKKINEIKEQDSNCILDTFLSDVENNNPIIGMDPISTIICDCLKQYKEEKNKNVVLVIEDLDRLDPAHLFRILNIFSAHIDFCYRYGCKPDETIFGNKFDFDKVVFVMDYENVQNIYQHFYGSKTSFNGYIDKFCSSKHFKYSLQEQHNEYFIQQINKATGIELDIIKSNIPSDLFEGKSIRDFVKSIKNLDESVLVKKEVRTVYDKVVPLHTGILRLIAIFRKLGTSDSKIIDFLQNIVFNKSNYSHEILRYLGVYLCLAYLGTETGSLQIKEDESFIVTGFDNDGKARIMFNSIYYPSRVNFRSSLNNLLEKVLGMVAK